MGIFNTIAPSTESMDLLDEGICTSCGEPCKEVAIDDSFDDAFGTTIRWSTGSECCEADVDPIEEDEDDVMSEQELVTLFNSILNS